MLDDLKNGQTIHNWRTKLTTDKYGGGSSLIPVNRQFDLRQTTHEKLTNLNYFWKCSVYFSIIFYKKITITGIIKDILTKNTFCLLYKILINFPKQNKWAFWLQWGMSVYLQILKNMVVEVPCTFYNYLKVMNFKIENWYGDTTLTYIKHY